MTDQLTPDERHILLSLARKALEAAVLDKSLPALRWKDCLNACANPVQHLSPDPIWELRGCIVHWRLTSHWRWTLANTPSPLPNKTIAFLQCNPVNCLISRLKFHA